MLIQVVFYVLAGLVSVLPLIVAYVIYVLGVFEW